MKTSFARVCRGQIVPPYRRQKQNSYQRMVKFKPGKYLRDFLRILRHPENLRTILREAYRHHLGMALDRRFGRGRCSMPSVLSLELTRRCNLRCQMCPQLRHLASVPGELSWYDRSQEMSLTGWVGVLDQAVAFKPRLYVTGGEPLLHRDFGQIIAEAKRRKLYVELQTNGTLLADYAELLVGSGVEKITISIDGTPEVHDAIRGRPGAFALLEKGVRSVLEAGRKLRRPGPSLCGTCIITRDNIGILDVLPRVAAEIGLDSLRFEHPIIDTPENTARHNAIFTKEFAEAHGLHMIFPSVVDGEYYQNRMVGSDLQALSEKLRQLSNRSWGMEVSILPVLSGETLFPYYFDFDYPFSEDCNALWKVCKIASDGSVLPCLHLVMGNVTRQSLAEIWNGAPMVSFRKLILNGLFPGCARCCRRSFARSNSTGCKETDSAR
ncbi:MAG: radical SAM protein [Verrucomicrobia bacterium]|nr:radical SAM protein [Verrucomicrobiota bacterium]